MGGLVVKKAYILGQSDPQYQDIVQSVRSIVFLSTPHRGTNLAELLNKILSVSLFNHSPKKYITELKQNSPALQDINELFRNIAPKLQIVSLYETQPTSIGPKKLMVLEKESSILGYPNEISKALDADHHNVCKYVDASDPNYVSVRNILRSLLGRFSVPIVRRESHGKSHDTQKLSVFLGVTAPPNEDFDFFRDRWMPGSCEWIHKEQSFNFWVEDNGLQSRVLWIHGVPGAGKSVLSSYIVKYLSDAGVSCQYFFFRYGEQQKRSVNALFRSIAYQIAREIPEYGYLLSHLAGDVDTIAKADARSLWQKLFLTGLFTLRLSRPLYWLVDALDECDMPEQLLSFIADVTRSQGPIRILLVSRRTQALSMKLQRMAENLNVATLPADQAATDLQQYVTKEIKYVPGPPDFKARISERILDSAHGNFLWVYLVLNNISQCHTEAAIEETLDEMPMELEPLYKRMESSLALNSHPRDRGLIKTILTWIACSRQSLTVEELSGALAPEYSNILDLTHTVVQVCGGFIITDKRGYLTMVHQTARDYLTKTTGLEYSIQPRLAHREIFLKCLGALSGSTQRLRSEQIFSQPFLLYASTSWSYHLALSLVSLDHIQTITLAKFFQGPSVLAWIQALALTGQLRCLVHSSQSITSYLGKQAKIDAESSPLNQRLRERDFLEAWAIDLVKVLGKFRTNIVHHPRSIQKLVPAFCPKNSMLYRQYRPRVSPGSLRVTGLSSSDWDDCLAKINLSRDTQALRIECGNRFFAILTSSGTLTLYHTATCEEVRSFAHTERVLCFAFDDSWQRLVTYGFFTTKIWHVRSGEQLCCFPNPRNAKALAVSFLRGEDVIVSCSDDRAIRRAGLETASEGWTVLETSPGGDGFDGKTYNSPRRVAYSADGLQVAIAYRGFPLIVWAIDSQSIVGYCERLTDRTKRSQDLWTDVGPICWNPITDHVLGLYNDGCIFKWHPLDSETYELKAYAADIQCSPNGNVFVTSSVDGTLRIWSFHHFALVYTLSCHTPVTDMAISPDGSRIYDLRDSFCHIWEPNALLRLAEADDGASDTSSTLGGLPQAAEASSEMLSPITAIAVNPQDSSYCVGDDDGSLRLHQSPDSSSFELSRTFVPVEHAMWSNDGSTLAVADLGGRISVWARATPTSIKGMTLSFEARIGRNIRQILLSQGSDYILAVTQGPTELWSLGTKKMVTSRPSLGVTSQWIYHPIQGDLVLEVESTEIKVFSWEGLAHIGSVDVFATTLDDQLQDLDITQKAILRNPLDRGSITKVLTTSDGSHLLFQTSSTSSDGQTTKQILLVPSSFIPTSMQNTPQRMTKATSLPMSVTRHIESLMGLVGPRAGRGSSAGIESGDTLVFLDRESWVCSLSLGESDAEAGVKRHFFIPQDWLNADYLRLSAVAEDGILFIPKNGEVAVIYNGLREAWFD